MASHTPDGAGAEFAGIELHVVTGKGGTGKSTVAAALALALASSGRNVLLCEVEGRQGIARMFDVEPLPYAETSIARGLPDETGRAGRVWALHVDAESALLEYLEMYYRLGRAGKALDKFGVVEFATTIAPGVRDVLLTGKVYEAALRQRRGKDATIYDAVVLDAPPIGRINQFLNVNSELAGLARVGPIKTQADKVMTLLRSERTVVHLVTLLEEMPVQETLDGIAALREIDLRVGAVVVNQVRPQSLQPDQLSDLMDGGVTPEMLAPTLESVGLSGSCAAALIHEGREHAVRRQLEADQRAVVAGLQIPRYELPLLADGIDLAALQDLAAALVEQRMV